MCDPENLRYAFNTEWFDAEASLTRPYLLFYYPSDCSVELTDSKLNRTFLRRTRVEGVSLDQLYEGASLHIFGRLMTVLGFADDFTRNRLSLVKQRTFAMVKPDAVAHMGEILKAIQDHGFTVSRMKLTRLSEEGAAGFYEEHKGKHFFDPLMQFVTSGPVLALELVAENAVARWRELIGPTDSAKAREAAPDSLRARFGTNATLNAVHGSDSAEAAAREAAFFFPDSRSCRRPGLPTTACFANNTCCVILPHLVKAGRVGEVLQAIEAAGFRVAAAEMFYMENANAEEFYEIYKGVVPEYGAMVAQLVSGPCVALEITGDGDDLPERFRKCVGPRDPEMARHLRPGSLRARFGVDRVQMGLHCSDLPEDGPLEVDYFFKILQ
ncbi:hypothetical protein R5R35_002138 [Gryllus longicercus]|uniref:DM10 domain-containing protein n=1 Tax=Gryllus longicercus TaxID=2509291 RepID=A0AAN9VF58_9ORTH